MDWGAAAAAERAPVGDDAVLDRVLEREDATLGLRLVADIRVLLPHADHHARLARPADDGREDGARRVVAREARLAHAGAVVHHERRNLVVRHVVWCSGASFPRLGRCVLLCHEARLHQGGVFAARVRRDRTVEDKNTREHARAVANVCRCRTSGRGARVRRSFVSIYLSCCRAYSFSLFLVC